MLILGRREGERVVIDANGQRIVVEVCRIGGDAVRIGFTADKSVVRINREEVLERKEDERK